MWQGRFYSCVLNEPRLLLASRYIERNPVRAGIVEHPWQWLWSSALSHISGQKDGFIHLGDLLGLTGISYEAWKDYIDSAEDADFLKKIKKHTFSGHTF